MVLQVFSIYDEVTCEFQGFFVERNEASGVREFATRVMTQEARNQGLLFSHPEDFSLWLLAELDTDSGVFTNYPQSKRICFATEVSDYA